MKLTVILLFWTGVSNNATSAAAQALSNDQHNQGMLRAQRPEVSFSISCNYSVLLVLLILSKLICQGTEEHTFKLV